jgi:hypothetical protein
MSFAISSGMDRWPSGSTLPMNLYVFAVLSMYLSYHIYNHLSNPRRILLGYFLNLPAFHYFNIPAGKGTGFIPLSPHLPISVSDFL